VQHGGKRRRGHPGRICVYNNLGALTAVKLAALGRKGRLRRGLLKLNDRWVAGPLSWPVTRLSAQPVQLSGEARINWWFPGFNCRIRSSARQEI